MVARWKGNYLPAYLHPFDPGFDLLVKCNQPDLFLGSLVELL